MSVTSYSLKKHGNQLIAPNFRVKEFRCKDGSDEILIDTNFVFTKLQKIRDRFAKSVTINSAYRTPTYNAKIGGAKNSYHMKGMAYDIKISGVTPLQVAQYAEQIGILGIIVYPTFTHIDSRTKKYFSKDAGKTSCDTFDDSSYQVEIICDKLRIRKSATTLSSTLGYLLKGQKVSVLETNGNWGRIAYNGINGWICIDSKYCKK